MQYQKASLTVEAQKVAEFRRATGGQGGEGVVPPTFPVALEHQSPPIVDLVIGMGYPAERLLHGEETIDWRTLVFSARTEAEELDPIDWHEIAEARWGSSDELEGPIRTALLQTGRALWRYRVALHDAALQALGYTGTSPG